MLIRIRTLNEQLANDRHRWYTTSSTRPITKPWGAEERRPRHQLVWNGLGQVPSGPLVLHSCDGADAPMDVKLLTVVVWRVGL